MILPLPWEAVRCISLKPRAGRDGKCEAMRPDLQPSAAALAELALEANETLADLASALPPPA